MESAPETGTCPPISSTRPREHRMGGIIQTLPVDFIPNSPPMSPKREHPPELPPTSRTPPPPPPRSPLRGTPRSVSSFTTILQSYTQRDSIAPSTDDTASSVSRLDEDEEEEESTLIAGAMSLQTLLDQLALNSPILAQTPTITSFAEGYSLADEKPLPILPEDESPLHSPAGVLDPCMESLETSTISSSIQSGPVSSMTKRNHALHELLSSERSYASDLAFIRDVHIPLALGRSVPFQYITPVTPPSSSGSSIRTSAASDSSSSSNGGGPPMTRDDVKVIFGNIEDLARFSDNFSERLEDALGSVLEGGKGDDYVGKLFLETIPTMEEPYKAYITRHPVAIAHLNSLPHTPALANYLAQSQSLASAVTHAWDLPSLLIKPVQRLLKYSLLLSTIIEYTPDDHGDKENLRKAREQMEDVARRINEGRRRLEVVKEVLTGRTDTGAKRKNNVGKQAAVSLGRMKSIGVGLRVPRPKEDSNEETARVEAYEKQLKTCNIFVREFAKDVHTWSAAVSSSVGHLRTWAKGFGKTIGIDEDNPSEAFCAFLEVIDGPLSRHCNWLDKVIDKELYPQLARLLDTSRAPTRLLTAMHSLEPIHNSLLNLNYAKHRPSPAMVEASQNYIALRGQLCAELPRYLKLLDTGIVLCIRRFAQMQTQFWSAVRDEWGLLWDCLRMEGETNGGCEETLRLWWNRYSEVDQALSKLQLVRRERVNSRSSRSRSFGSASISDIPFSALPSLPHSPTPSYSTSCSSNRHRSFGSLDASMQRSARRTPSTESFSALSQRNRSRPRSPESIGTGVRYHRSNTSPLPTSSSSPTLNMYYMAGAQNLSSRDPETCSTKSDVQGRKSRSSSFSRRLSETLRTPLRRSPSHKSVGSTSSAPIPAMTKYGPPPLPTNIFDFSNPGKYRVVAVHPCVPPEGVSYLGLPFFELQVDDVFTVLHEAGHPSECDDLPLAVDDESDCLLTVRDARGDVGWALASFLVPFT